MFFVRAYEAVEAVVTLHRPIAMNNRINESIIECPCTLLPSVEILPAERPLGAQL